MPPKSAKAKVLPPKKESEAAKAASAPKPALNTSATRPATKSSGKALPSTKSPPNNKPKASKRSREEEHQTGKDDRPAPSQAYRDLMAANGADPFQALSSALISKLPCEVVMELIERGCGDVNAYGKIQLTSPEGTELECTATPLILASYHGSVEVVNQLINEAALINAMGDCKGNLTNNGWKGAQAIHWAAARGHVSVVKALIANNATVHAPTNEKWTPLHFAAQAGHLEVAQLLLSGGANVHLATDSSSAVRKFGKGWTALHFAATDASPDVMRALLANGGAAHINALNYLMETPLHIASGSGNLPTVEELIANNADVNATNSRKLGPLAEAASSGHLPVVKRLLACTSQLSMAVCCAARSGNVDVLEAVLGHPSANVEELAEDGCCRPLDIAVDRGHLNAVRTLLSHGANPDGNQSDDNRPIHFTSSWTEERPAILRLLIDSGADVNILDETGRSALQIAATYNGTECAQLLLESGAIDNERNTPKTAVRHDDDNDISCVTS